jgi:hypothetical protein
MGMFLCSFDMVDIRGGLTADNMLDWMRLSSWSIIEVFSSGRM